MGSLTYVCLWSSFLKFSSLREKCLHGLVLSILYFQVDTEEPSGFRSDERSARLEKNSTQFLKSACFIDLVILYPHVIQLKIIINQILFLLKINKIEL